MKNYDLLLFLLEKKLNKEMWPPDPFGHTHAPLGIIQVIHLLGKSVSQPTSPLEWMLQLQTTMDLAISPDKLH